MLKYALILLFAAMALPASAGAVYKCTDADGKTYYSGQRCPDSAESERLRVQRPADDGEDAAPKSKRKSLDEQIAETDDPVRKAQLELRKKECELGRTQLKRYDEAPYLIRKNDDGSEQRLSDEEAAAEKARLRRKIEEQC